VSEDILKKAFEELSRNIKTVWASESITMYSIWAWQRLLHYSRNCRLFEKCPFGRLCLLGLLISPDVCEAVYSLSKRGLVEIEGEKNEDQV